MAFLEVKNLGCSYGKNSKKTMIFKNVTFSGELGECISILGPSGCGKSTLLHALLDFIPHTGEIKYSDNEKPAFVFQDSFMIDYFSLVDNVSIGLMVNGVDKGERDKKAQEKLTKVDVTSFTKTPSELSGGEKERVGIARALAMDKNVIVLDEPTGSLDSENSLKVADIINKIKRDKLVIVATHDREFASNISDEIYEFKNGELIKTSDNKKRVSVSKPHKASRGKMKFKDSLNVGAKIIKHNKGKAILGSFFLSLTLAFIMLILNVCFNAHNTTKNLAYGYLDYSMTSVSKVERTKIDNSLSLTRNIRPDKDVLLRAGNDVYPSLKGVLPSTITIKSGSKTNEVLYNAMVCDQTKLKEGRCPNSYDEVVINSLLEKMLGNVKGLSYAKRIDVTTNVNSLVLTDTVEMGMDLKVVGISSESSSFNLPCSYYDYHLMLTHLKSVELINTSKAFTQVVSLYDRIDHMSLDSEPLSGYEWIIISNDPISLRTLFDSTYETNNRSLEMMDSTNTLIESLGIVIELFLVMTMGVSLMLEFITLLTIYEDEKPVLSLYKSVGLNNGGFIKLSNGIGLILSIGQSLLASLFMFSFCLLARPILNDFNLETLVNGDKSLIYFFMTFLSTSVLSVIVTRLSLKKVLKGNLIECLKGNN